MSHHICSTGQGLKLSDSAHCGKPALELAELKGSKVTLYACGENHKREFGLLLKDLKWEPIPVDSGPE